MLYHQFKKPQDIQRVLKAIEDINTKEIKIMEVCGTHTMAIAKIGIKSLLPKNVKIISGPGCPVCVTPVERIDEILKLAEDNSVIIATYGDMLKVPGSRVGYTLERIKAVGGNVETVYSAVDAVQIAKLNPQKQVVFLGVGFETTAPGTALAIETALEEEVDNFSVFSMHKYIEPALRALIESDDFDIDGFICPGHVAVILGEDGFKFLSDEYKKASVICGFEAGDIVTSIYKLVKDIEEGRAELSNEYTRMVSKAGNKEAVKILDKYFDVCDDLWRGIGLIKKSGMEIKEEYQRFDAIKRFSIELSYEEKITACKCGQVIKGKQTPNECPLFGTVCTPENALGPCMVSSEGACAAYYKYHI